jgi:hypothetical protein
LERWGIADCSKPWTLIIDRLKRIAVIQNQFRQPPVSVHL